MATKLTLSTGLSLEPDSSPFTSGSMATDNGIIDGNRFTGQGGSHYWYYYYSYGADIGLQDSVDIIECYCSHVGGDRSAWYSSSHDSVSVFKSNDGSAWTLVERFDDPPVHYHASNQFGFRLTLSSSQTARYFKVVNVETSSTLGVVGGASLVMQEIEFYNTFTGYFSGYVYEQGVPAADRVVRAYNRSTGALIVETTSSGNGYYYLETTYSGAHYLVALDDDALPDFSDLIRGSVLPT